MGHGFDAPSAADYASADARDAREAGIALAKRVETLERQNKVLLLAVDYLLRADDRAPSILADLSMLRRPPPVR